MIGPKMQKPGALSRLLYFQPLKRLEPLERLERVQAFVTHEKTSWR